MGLKEESDYFETMDLAPYEGNWIAIKGKDVIAYARSFGDVHSTVSKMTDPSKVLFLPVPDCESLIL